MVFVHALACMSWPACLAHITSACLRKEQLCWEVLPAVLLIITLHCIPAALVLEAGQPADHMQHSSSTAEDRGVVMQHRLLWQFRQVQQQSHHHTLL